MKPENVAPIHVDGGLLLFMDRFVYLGSIISSDLADDAECGARIACAAGAFGCLGVRIFGEPLVDLRAKSAAYQALILNLLFYGSECFVFTHAQTSSLLPQTVRAHHVRVLLKHGGCNILPLRAHHLSRRARETYVHA